MPKSEKATTGRAKRAGKAEGGRKKKGAFLTSLPTTLTVVQN